jgi:hypothetical protein
MLELPVERLEEIVKKLLEEIPEADKKFFGSTRKEKNYDNRRAGFSI